MRAMMMQLLAAVLGFCLVCLQGCWGNVSYTQEEKDSLSFCDSVHEAACKEYCLGCGAWMREQEAQGRDMSDRWGGCTHVTKNCGPWSDGS